MSSEDRAELQQALDQLSQCLRTIVTMTARTPHSNFGLQDPLLTRADQLAKEVTLSPTLSQFLVQPTSGDSTTLFQDADPVHSLPAHLRVQLNLSPASPPQPALPAPPATPATPTTPATPADPLTIASLTYEQYKRNAKQDLAQYLRVPVEYREEVTTNVANYKCQAFVDNTLFGEFTSSKKKAKTYAAIITCCNRAIIPFVIPSKRKYWIETYFPNTDIELPSDDEKDEAELMDARNRVYSRYSSLFNLVPRYEYEQDSSLMFHCKLYIADVLKAQGEGRSKKLAANDAALTLLRKENL